MVPEIPCPYTVALEARLSHDRFGEGSGEGEGELSLSVEPGGGARLSPSAFNRCREQVSPCSCPLSRGLVLSLLYKEGRSMKLSSAFEPCLKVRNNVGNKET